MSAAAVTGPFSTVLVANRGEIACRIIRSARSLGYRTVAIYSDADAQALHVRLADVAARVGAPPSSESYLAIDNILAAARRTGADAIHPGYGFLSENDRFAAACRAAGLIFVGPPAEAIHLMGDKARARRRMAQIGVGTIPGWDGGDGSVGGAGANGDVQDEAALLRAAENVGYPLLVKAAAGGGGRGMRLVRARDELPAALRRAAAEARAAFGDGRLLLERALIDARHVEIQVLADRMGNVVHLGERDCSIQRRYQKVVEEAPSPAVDPALRARMGEAAVAVARDIGYVGAGTVEFLLEPNGAFHFLEMNTRLQVEHPVTELVTGLDLVALQLRVAAGEPLPFSQRDVTARGHAIEVRLYAEDPYAGFLPQTGRLVRWAPGIPGTQAGTVTDGQRIDHGLVAGQEITAFYDPLLAKLVAWGETRELARRRLRRLLADTVVLGVTTNKSFLGAVLEHPVFASGQASTGFIGAALCQPGETTPRPPPVPDWLRATAAVLLSLPAEQPADRVQPAVSGEGGWSVRMAHGNAEATLVARIRVRAEAACSVQLGDAKDQPIDLLFLPAPPGEARVAADGVQHRVSYARAGEELLLDAPELALALSFREVIKRASGEDAAAGDGRVLAPMSGRIVSVHVGPGDAVARGQVVLVLEAMKMQCQVLADTPGRVAGVLVGTNAQVARRQLLVEITPQGAPA